MDTDSPPTVATRIIAELTTSLRERRCRTVLINMHPLVADHLYQKRTADISKLEETHQTLIIPVARDGYQAAQYEILKSEDDDTTP